MCHSCHKPHDGVLDKHNRLCPMLVTSGRDTGLTRKQTPGWRILGRQCRGIMKDFYFGVTIIVIDLCFPGTATTPPRKSSVLHNSERHCDGPLLTSWSTRHTSQIADTVDVSSPISPVLFQSHTRKEWQITRLDLSNHSISFMTLSALAPFHALELLNLSNNAMHSLWLDLPLPRPSQQKRHTGGGGGGGWPCSLPRLKVLILQRNQLRGTPKGLWKLESLQSLDLSFNRIVHIGLSDFHSCLQLERVYLKSNKIRTVHPDAFKDLKKLQVVDLRSNALTTLAPIVTIALELPHLELDLADNQWQCGENNANFQNVTSASWREKWNAICNMSVGNEKPYLETPQIRISRNTHLLPTPSDVKSLMQNKAERPQGGIDSHLSALEKEAQVDYDDLKEIWPQPPTELRDSEDEHVTDRKDDAPDLVLPICLSVFSTFLVAFCLGAFARPYIDRLWQQRCLTKRPGSENAYSNEGFYDDVEAPRRVQHQGTEPHQASRHLNLYERQNPSQVTEPTPYSAAMAERVLGNSKMDLSSQQSPGQPEDDTGAGNRDCDVLPYGHTAHAALHGLPNADTRQLISAVQDHRDVPEELHYDTVVPEYSLYEDVMDRSSVLGTEDSGCNELRLSQSRDVVAPVSNTLVHMNTQGSGESKERGSPEALGAMGSLMESSEERQF
ncbi:leucine-rich repeat-containing protein 66 isoform X2 [Peromyscus maniculatus bairdii]|uniref:leucine-rich repeat-containing protein 66 isoform X2 n=1 Tax=Peromyscus maniculatus bairdii TaxID=230844 RepID=UPI003FD20C2D